MERSVYDAAGGSAALGRLAAAWHHRCLQDPVVSHAFSHPGLHPQHVERLAAYWGEALGGPAGYTAGWATTVTCCGCTPETASTPRWTGVRSSASPWLSMTPECRMTRGCGAH